MSVIVDEKDPPAGESWKQEFQFMARSYQSVSAEERDAGELFRLCPTA
jgi:hypothetical protein